MRTLGTDAEMAERLAKARRNTRYVWWAAAICFGILIAWNSTR
jgi:hypothetical protein